MLRFLLSPRQVALHLVALLLMAAMAWLSLWQLGKARGDVPEAAAAPVALAEVSTPGRAVAQGAYDRIVTASGRYDAEAQVLVPDRILEARSGLWVVVPLRVPGATVAVVRGWIAPTEIPPAPPTGELTVTGRFLPSEETPVRAPELPAGRIAAVDLTALGAEWANDLHEGFVVAADESPPPASTPTRVPESNAVPSDTGAPFSNTGYALQWWAFSAFVGYLWWRILRDRWQARTPIAVAPERATAPTGG